MALTRHCSVCGGDRVFEQPPCVDDHGAGCPEWACAECGSAILIGDVPEFPAVIRVRAA